MPKCLDSSAPRYFGTSAWTLRHYSTTPLRQCAGLQYGNDQGHSRSSLLHGGSGSLKVTGNDTIRCSTYDFLFDSRAVVIYLSKVAYFDLPHLYLAHVYCCQMTGWIKMSLGMEVRLVPGHTVLDVDSAASLPPQKGHKAQQPPIFGPCLLWPNSRPSQQLLSSCAK